MTEQSGRHKKGRSSGRSGYDRSRQRDEENWEPIKDWSEMPRNRRWPGVRLCLLISIVMTMGVFTFAMMSNTAFVHMTTASYVFGVPVEETDKNIYNLSLFNSIKDLWKADSKGIAILILALSYVLPLLKLFYLLAIVNYDPKGSAEPLCPTPMPKTKNGGRYAQISKRNRHSSDHDFSATSDDPPKKAKGKAHAFGTSAGGSQAGGPPYKQSKKSSTVVRCQNVTMFIFDFFGKFALTNVLVLILCINGLYQNISYTAEGTAVVWNNLDASFYIECDTGIIAFTVGIILSMILSAIVQGSYLHWYTGETDSEYIDLYSDWASDDYTDDSSEDFKRHNSSGSMEPHDSTPLKPHRNNDRPSTKSIAMLMLVLVSVTIVGGIVAFFTHTPFISFEYVGYLTTDSDATLQDPVRSFTFLSIGMQTVSHVQNMQIGLWMNIVYHFFVIWLPCVVCGGLVVFWLVTRCVSEPMGFLRGFIWSVHSFASLEVMLASTLAVKYELPNAWKGIIRDSFADYCEKAKEAMGKDFCSDLELNVNFQSAIWWAMGCYFFLWVSVIYMSYYVRRRAIIAKYRYTY